MTYEDAMIARQRIDEPTSHSPALVTESEATQSTTDQSTTPAAINENHEQITRRAFEMNEHHTFESMKTNRPKLGRDHSDTTHNPMMMEEGDDDDVDTNDEESESFPMDDDETEDVDNEEESDVRRPAMGKDRSRVISRDDIESIRGRALNITSADHHRILQQQPQQPYSGIVYVTAPTTSAFLPRSSSSFHNDLSNVDIEDIFPNSEHLAAVPTTTPAHDAGCQSKVRYIWCSEMDIKSMVKIDSRM